MHAAARAVTDLVVVLMVGFVAFFVMLAHLASLLIWFACGVVCFCLLLVALFSMGVWLASGDAHAFHVMLGYFVYAGAIHALIAALSYVGGNLSPGLRSRHMTSSARRDGFAVGPSLTYHRPGGQPVRYP
jgi:hypothetical protein